jgi:Carboxypeptidase regulatory-like domain/TonB dependent receptor
LLAARPRVFSEQHVCTDEAEHTLGEKRVSYKVICRWLAVYLAIGISFAQVASRIGGTVSDNGGAVMAGVKVVVTDTERGTMFETTTNDSGRYSFPNLRVGKYVVSASASGFKTSSTNVINIDVNQSVDVNITMELGTVSEKVEVVGAAPLLQTSDSQVGGLIENKTINELPLAARDFMQLALLAPGVANSTGNSRHQTERATWIGSFSVHGQRAQYNQYLFDGMSGKEMQHETNMFSPSLDAIAEVKIETANYDAEFGSEAGGHINVVTKSGTNQFHGAAYEFLRNDLTNAKESYAVRKAELRRNTFGAALGGPIKKEKTFFFGSWESMRLRQGFTQNTTVPTPAFRNGDFSSLLKTDFSNPRPVVIYDWTTGQPFNNNVVPQSQLNPLAQAFMNKFVPLANQAGSGGIIPINNYQSLAPQQTATDQFLPRIDHYFSPTTHLFGRYVISSTNTLGPPVWPAFSYSQILRGQQAMIDFSHTLDPTSIFELRLGYSRFHQTEQTESAFKNNVAQELGLSGACNQPACYHAPYWTVTNFSDFGNPSGATQGQGVSGPRGWKNEIFQLQASMFMQRGDHTIKFGFQGNRYRDTFVEAIYPAGLTSFNGQWTAGPGSAGFAMTDLVLGLPREIRASIDIFDPNYRNSQLMPWVQDDWKVNNRLTVNLGLRYEWLGNPVSKYNKIANFYQTGPSTATIITPTDTGIPGYTKRPDSVTPGLLMNDNNNFAPRVGFAFMAEKNTVIRGAYGMFYQRDAACTWINLSINAPFIRTGDAVLSVNQASFQTFPVNNLTPVVGYLAPGSKPAVTGINVDMHESYVHQWNLYIDHTFAKDLVVKAGYVGNHALGLRRYQYPNEPVPGPGDVQSRRPFQNLGSVTLFSFSGQSNYQGLELEAQKRYGNGLTIISAYTWSKDLDNLTPRDMWFGSSWKEISSLNVGQRFSFAGTWEIPYGRGRRFGSGSPPVVNALLGGWQLSASAEARTGFPLNVTLPTNVANTGGITQVPNLVANPNLPRDQQTLNRFFNTAAFTNPAPYTLGNAQMYTVVGPSFQNLDSSLTKYFPIHERANLQLRSEFFNMLNHPNWGNPGTTLGTATFGRITSTTGDPRTLQFALKLLF